MSNVVKIGNAKIRIILLIAYWIAAWPIAIYFTGHGHMSFVPMSILLSWPGVFAKFSGELLLLFPITYVLYHMGLLALTTQLSRRRRVGASLIPGAIHFSGGGYMLAVFGKEYVLPPVIYEPGPIDWVTTLIFFVSYVVSLAITSLWLFTDRRLASGGNQS
jgi:hypothetical protein